MTKSSKKGQKKDKKRKIKPRHRQFIDNFINTNNATQSYIDANYSIKGAGQAARKLLKKDHIQAEIARRRKEIARKANITADDVINEYAKIAFANSEDFFEWGVQEIEMIQGSNVFKKVARILIKPPEEIQRDKKAAISGIKETSKGGLEFKFFDKQKALDSLGRYFGVSTEAEIDKIKKIKFEEKGNDSDSLVEERIKEKMKIHGFD